MPLAGLLAGTLIGAIVAFLRCVCLRRISLLTLSMAVAYPIILRQVDGNSPVTLDGACSAGLDGIQKNDEHIWEFFLVAVRVNNDLLVQGLYGSYWARL